MPTAKDKAVLTVGDTQIAFEPRALRGFEEAQAFASWLAAKGTLSPDTIEKYVKFAARLRRQQRIDTIDMITRTPEKTAARAYRKWKTESYRHRLKIITDAFGANGSEMERVLPWLRRGSIVPPHPGKVVPTPINPITRVRDYTPCDKWTLHVPSSDVKAHTDPCDECAIIELTDAQVEAIARAFELTWGSRDAFWTVDKDKRLLGEPPAATVGKEEIAVVALSEHSQVSEAISRVHGTVTRDVNAFLTVLQEGADVVCLSRRLRSERPQDVIAAINAWWTAP